MLAYFSVLMRVNKHSSFNFGYSHLLLHFLGNSSSFPTCFLIIRYLVSPLQTLTGQQKTLFLPSI